MDNKNLTNKLESVLPSRNLLTFCRLVKHNPVLFKKSWARLPASDKAAIRESVRLKWCREFEYRTIYGHFLIMTE